MSFPQAQGTVQDTFKDSFMNITDGEQDHLFVLICIHPDDDGAVAVYFAAL